jgi:hypothetical protein
MKASEAVGAAYYSLKLKVDQFAPGQQMLLCPLSIGNVQVQQDASYKVEIGCFKSRKSIEEKSIVRAHVCGFNWRICCSKLTNRSEGDRTVGHSIASFPLPASDFGFQQRWELILAMYGTDAVWIDLGLIRRPVITLLSRHHVRKSAIGIKRSTLSKARSNKPGMTALPRTIGDEYLLRRQWWNRFDPIAKLAMTTFFYIWNQSFAAYDRFIFLFLDQFSFHGFMFDSDNLDGFILLVITQACASNYQNAKAGQQFLGQ